YKAQPDPDREGVAGAGKGVVSFARLIACLVEIDHDGKTGKKEKQAVDQEVPAVAGVLEDKADQAQDQGQHEHAVIGFVVRVDAVRQFALVSVEQVVEGCDA